MRGGVLMNRFFTPRCENFDITISIINQQLCLGLQTTDNVTHVFQCGPKRIMSLKGTKLGPIFSGIGTDQGPVFLKIGTFPNNRGTRKYLCVRVLQTDDSINHIFPMRSTDIFVLVHQFININSTGFLMLHFQSYISCSKSLVPCTSLI